MSMLPLMRNASPKDRLYWLAEPPAPMLPVPELPMRALSPMARLVVEFVLFRLIALKTEALSPSTIVPVDPENCIDTVSRLALWPAWNVLVVNAPSRDRACVMRRLSPAMKDMVFRSPAVP